MGKLHIMFIVILFLFAAIFISESKFDWRDQVIYFLMIDRFNNGDISNDILTDNGIESGNENSKYNGGDIAGIIKKLDYIRNLGATAIWITPPVENQWWDGSVSYGGYHGYWASNFKKIEPHFGEEDTYSELINTAHGKGLKVIQDIVANHVGNFYMYDRENDRYSINEQSVPMKKPSQYPFNMNDFNDTNQKNMNVYNWESEIADPNVFNTSFADLDDLNTKNENVFEELINSYDKWKSMGVDGFRIDTVIYVEDEFWKKFLSDKSGIMKDDDFLVFGEAWKTPQPFDNGADKEINRYFSLGFNSMLDFTLMTEITRVFKEGKPTEMLSYRLAERENIYGDNLLVTFIDNHDTMRFLKGSTYIDLKQALTLIFTIPGIPCIYYGTEQGFSETRACMFENGFESGGKDHFNEESEYYDFIKKISSIRENGEPLRRGKVKILCDTPDGPGPFIYSLRHNDEEYMVILNTSSRNKYATGFSVGESGAAFSAVYTEGMSSKDLVAGDEGKMNILLAAKSIGIFKKSGEIGEYKKSDMTVGINIENLTESKKDNFVISGYSSGSKRVRLFIDGNEAYYAQSVPDEYGKWEFEVKIADFKSGNHLFFVKGYGKKATDYVYSGTYNFDLDIPVESIGVYEDLSGDDKGISGDYLYPKGEGGYENQMDIEGVEIQQIGRTIRMIIKTKNVTDKWNPSNGFDHVTFQIFLDKPGKKGSRILPFQNAVMPEGYDWDYEIYATGWSLNMSSEMNSNEKNYGITITPAPVLKTNKENNTITLLIPMEVLETDSMDGWNVYVTTYDYDGIEAVLRPISPNPWKWSFYGPSENSPKIMDDLLINIK